MKPDSTVTPPPLKTEAAPKQWQGLDEYVGSKEFLEAVQNEFPEGASEFTDEVSRRRFVGLMGASVALATGAGCYLRPAPAKKIVPYTTQPDEIQPGNALYFASAAPLSGYGNGVIVRSNEGRPTKIEGNPSHPSSLGGSDSFGQASILDMYDPDRSRGVTHRGLAASVEEAISAARNQLYDNAGKPKAGVKLRLLTETVTSPTLSAQFAKLLADFPEARWAQHDPATSDSVREGTTKAFGKPLNVTYDFTKADVILALDADFLEGMPGSVRYSREFGDRRKIRHHGKTEADIHGGKKDEHAGHDHDHKEGVQPNMLNRLYAVEAMPSTVGSVADHRLALPTTLVESFARALAVELGVNGVAGYAALSDEAKSWLKPLADDLKAKGGKSIVIAGGEQPGSLHALVAAINAKLGNAGKTVFYSAPVDVKPAGKVIDLKTLTKEMGDRQVDVLFIFGVNAAYTAPVDVPFGENIKNVAFTYHIGLYQDETAVKCHWHVNESFYLESWGDIRGHDGTVGLQQPLIAPLFNGKSVIELLAGIMASPVREGYEIVRAYWKNGDEARKTFPAFPKIEATGFEVFWQQAVRAGVIPGTASPADTTALGNWSADSPAAPTALPALGGDFEINFRPDPTLYDGRYANNGWLQELPKPITKLTWDNAIFMSDATAKKLGLDPTYFRWTGGEHGRAQVDVLEITYRGRKLKGPVWVLPNHADGSITIHLGHGRDRAGRVASTPGEPNAAGEPVRGFNAYALRTSDALWYAVGGKEAGKNDLTIVKVPKKVYYLACTQGQTSMVQKDLFINHEWDRKPVRIGDLELYKKDPAFAKIPPMAARETHEIDANVPAPSHNDHAHEHEAHDTRLKSLTMYYDDNEEKFKRFTPGLAKDQQRRWSMAIDLNACTGCGACVVACQSENNIPVVGKDQVTKGRIMHWISIDRYYEGKPGDANLKTLFQPRMCVQCENAPCEIVCPVGATVHSADGLNDMTYNRCVGTRYCSNNCPYKVRRFNFLTFADFDTNTLKLGRNPDVSVRSRGVMEKCTFCVQRIRGAEIVAEREARKIKDGEILTACQSACPSAAIVFGDLNEDHSAVARWKNEPTNYGLLAELNTRPRLTHMAIIRNPNLAMPAAKTTA